MNHQSASARRARTSVLARTVSAALPIAVLALVLAAGPADAQTSTTTPPFTSGMLSALTGSTLTVQARNGRSTTVVVTGSTAYQQTTTATASDIAQGDCVRVVGTGSATSGIQATTVVVTKPTSKSCTRNPAGGNGGGAGGRRFGNGTPGSTPFTLPGGSAGTVPANLAAAFGTVHSVSGDQLTVKGQAPRTTKKTKPKTETVSVTLTVSTTVTETVKGAVTDLAVGSCVTANGTADSLGTITAKSVTVSQPVNGSCGGGFGGFGGFGGRFGSGAGGGGTPTSSA